VSELPELGGGLSQDPLLTLFQEVSNWGRWGTDDELGTLNYVTANKVIEAAGLVKSGRVVSVAHDIDTIQSRKNRVPAVYMMLYRGQDSISAVDLLSIVAHSVTVTHVDAVSHAFFGDHVYNGRTVAGTVKREGLDFGSVHAQRGGVTTRGIFLDVAATRGVAYLTPEETVSVADLEAAERASGCLVKPGDAVLVRVGLGAREAIEGPEDPSTRAGLAVDCLRWLHSKKVSLFGGDCFDKLPSPYRGPSHPLHAIGLAAMGLIMLDNVAMEPLAEACAAERRSEFMFVVAPLRVPKGTGSAVNPLCIF
jgi:kynurenine formamidase